MVGKDKPGIRLGILLLRMSTGFLRIVEASTNSEHCIIEGKELALRKENGYRLLNMFSFDFVFIILILIFL